MEINIGWIIISWIIFTGIAMLIAGHRKVNIGYAFLWCLLTPIAGIIYALVAKPPVNIQEQRKESIKHSIDIPDSIEKATDKNKEAAYSMIEDNNGNICGIWLKEPDKLKPDQKGYIEVLLVSNASHLLDDYLAKSYRVISNNYDAAGGCFVMFGGNKAPGE